MPRPASQRAYQPLLWCVVPVPGHCAIPVYFVSDEHEPFLAAGEHPVGGGEKVAFCDRPNWAIKIWAGEEQCFYARHLAHELMHAVLTDSEWMDHVLNITEEKVLHALSEEGVHEMFLALGWTPPDLPNGLRGLAVHARFVRYGRKRRRCRAAA